ncbi:preprotein translocase subunit YajC [Fructobacillus evanidus]|uniref:Protein translocase subunit YajC (YajC) n=1 Tax=Fructobacillus evanidus TaxID=3064281 RepID=A0ABN9YPF7_9LACO|nr:Protein translocase subunit YajC (YajC) [Fructobacillus sp. LMG 32999]CAK1231251.1 Protein translocase subunit YajC (YajC) [Fructobacillus sp. LMG 32999]CAK1233321.1 Protein translocase subunit YajC (YajC) [Fructobacillus sp. LMG 32999]CAK1235277.1 Protein translocase subunit YajC (YajC) [Fructobacillus sp. LMG 32999]CAK1239247.1 Protein translocase subunit YajC (YajC) [Fructobacillus sp. LMG 32999]
MSNLLFPLLILVVMLWWMSRTSKKQQQRQQAMRSNMKPGAKVVTIGGLHAVVDAVNEEAKTVDLDAEGVILTFEATAIRTVKPEEEAKPEEVKPAEEAKSDDAAADEAKDEAKD